MAYNTQDDLEDRMGISTLYAIFDDNAGGAPNVRAILSVLEAAYAEVNSYFVRNYPTLLATVAVGEDGKYPQTLRNAEFELFHIFARDRKTEYWNNSRDNERRDRMKAAYDMLERYAEGKQQLYDTSTPKPDTVGGIVYDEGVRTLGDNDGF